MQYLMTLYTSVLWVLCISDVQSIWKHFVALKWKPNIIIIVITLHLNVLPSSGQNEYMHNCIDIHQAEPH